MGEGAGLSQVGGCEKFVFLISQSFDRKLSFWEWLGLRWHFLMCKGCQHEQSAFVTLRRMLLLYREDSDKAAHFSEEMLSDKTKERIKEVLRKRMREKEKEKKEKQEDAQDPPSDDSTKAS